jgi:hypothetical protein
VVTIPLGNDTTDNPKSLLVIAPPGAASVVAVSDGKDIASAQVKNAAAVLTVPTTEGVTVRALDPQGRVIATGGVTRAGGPAAHFVVDRWHEE